MPVEITQLDYQCYYFKGPVNIGYVNCGEHGLIVDTGLDKQVMKKVLAELDNKSLPVTHLFITHAHADHYGGAYYLQQHRNVHTVAPIVEEAILQNPILEPIYLLQGNRPLDEMRNKFLEGRPVRIDQTASEGLFSFGSIETELILLPGHSIYQLGVKIGNILYAADSYLGVEHLRKHKIPYLIDVDASLATIERLLSMNDVGMVPGHGAFEVNPTQTLIKNYDHHVSIVTNMYEILKQYQDGCSFEKFMEEMCEKWEVKLPSLSVWALYRTALFAYIIKGVEDEKVKLEIKNFSPYLVSLDE